MNNRSDIPPHSYSVKQVNDTWSMTPVTYASRFIQKMEIRYGSPERSWTYVGIEYHDGQPQVGVPGRNEISPKTHSHQTGGGSLF